MCGYGKFTDVMWGYDIFTDGENEEELKKNIRDAVHCHFDEGKAPQIIKLHFVREEALAL